MPGIVDRPKGTLNSLLFDVANTALDSALNGKYETYECPTCGSKVVYCCYQNAQGEVFKRMGEDIHY